MFDAKGKPITTPPLVAGGSQIKVSFEPWPYYTSLVGAGVTLRAKAVQIVKLVEYTSGSSNAYGFNEEDGYEVPENNNNNETDEFTDEAEVTKAAADF